MNPSTLRAECARGLHVLLTLLLAVCCALASSAALAGPTSITMTASPNPVAQGQPATLTATVTGGSNLISYVGFWDDNTELGRVTLNGNVATLSGVTLSVGTHALWALYPGDANNGYSETAEYLYLTVTAGGQTASTTALSVTPNPSTVGQNTTLTATVTPSAATGTVTFRDGATTIGTGTLSAGVATLSTSFSTSGAHSLTAVYAGNASYTTSTSSTVSQTVNKANSTTTLSSSSNPSTVSQSVTLTATVSGVSPSGTVTFKDGAATIGTGTLTSGVATLATSFSTAGAHSLTAVYAGDASNNTSTSTALSQTVNTGATTSTTTALTSSVNPSTVGQNTTLTATVTPSAATGTVTFKDGATTIGIGTLSAGVATLSTSFASAGNHILTASYGGDAGNAASTSAAGTQIVNAAGTSTGLTANPNPATDGGAVVLTATVSGGVSPSGSVTFKDGTSTLGNATLAGGQASLNTSLSGTGAHSLTASYAGDANHSASSSSALSVQVNAGAQTLPAPPASPAPVVNYEYDAQGNPTKTIQAPGVAGFNFATTNTYDGLDRLKDSTNAKAGLTQFGYNGREDLTQVTDPRNLVTQYPRNGLGDATSLVSPDTGTATHTYDAAGNLKTRTDSRGVLATHTYDALNRLTRIVYSKSGSTSLTYNWIYDQTGTGYANGVGRLTSTNSPTSSTQYTYDAQGRVLTDIQRIKLLAGANSAQVSKTVTYTYDAAGNVTSIVYPSGRKLSVTYTDGQPSALALAKDTGSAATNLISAIQWEPFGAPKSWLWQMASSTQAYERVYDTHGRLVRYRLGNTVRDITYDAGDRITAYTHYDATSAAATPSLDQSFGYDELGRITSVTTATASWTIGYDANGNRTSVTQNASTSVYTTAATNNRLTSLTNPARTLGYDNAGNTTSDSTSYTSTYNLAGRMATLTKAGVTTTYSVDGMNRRVRKFSSTGATSTIIFVYDQQGQLLGEYSNTGTPLREYVWLGSTPIAMFVPDTVAANPPLVYYFHTDHLDTPRAVLDKSNNLRWRWLAEPFGTTAPENNPQSLGAFTQPLRFPGQYADAESGLNYNVNRDYDASIGRYTQSDPIGLQGGINTYAYVGGNPVTRIDPEGLMGRGGMPSTPGPRAAASCTCSEIQVSLGVGGLAGFGPTIVPAGFVGLGAGFGFTTSGMFFVQGQGTLAVGAGVFAGGGVQVGGTRNVTQTRPGFSDSYAIQGDVNFGAGPSVGGSVQASPDGAGVQTGIGRLGVGYGAQASVGVTRTLTYAWQILPSLRCECCP